MLVTIFPSYTKYSAKPAHNASTLVPTFVNFISTPAPPVHKVRQQTPPVRKGIDNTTMTRKIIIDTDPGQDDAVAILLALASPKELEVAAIVAVAGNVGLRQNAINALKVVELAGRTDVPVFAGYDRPIRRKLVTAEHVHGKTGLDGPDLAEPQIKLQEQHGVDFIIETIRNAASKEITICALGPLTNVAMALLRAPDIAPKIGEIVLMGGACFEGGNITPSAEFNFYVDPEAADIVMRSGVEITMLPLDVTHRILATGERIQAIKNIGNNTGRAIYQMLDFSERFDLEKYQWLGAPVHDPCVIAWLLEPEIFSGRKINVEIEVTSELTRGMSVADYWGVTSRTPNVNFIRDGDAERFYQLLTERLSRLP
ncbi:Inosine-uridine preferring nucleoside hydrolase [hydrothermal vent metagenome]|uniref:Inosine-uridine preferring nucleoside hydrolase n=1 Tax=hydrothermal vent metagenome TaxID=652676 RepID=A0A3B0TL40_9ZZZZ